MDRNPGHLSDHRELAHRQAITEVIYQHCRGLDRLDLACLKTAYWPDAEVDYGSYVGNAHQFAELVVGALGDQYELTRHSLDNTLISLADSSACVESHVTARHLLRGGGEELMFFGRYLDRLQLREDCWKISHRQVVMDWSRRHPVEDERNSESFAALAKGTHASDDPLYPFLARSGLE